MYDYIIIGSGIAGLFTALLASEHGSVLVLTKGALEESNTRYAQGGIAAAMAPEDSPALHYADTLAAGAGLCDETAVRVLTEEAPARIRDLLRLGVPFDRHEGTLALGLEGAHQARRVLHAGGDATGFHIEKSLCQALRAAGATFIEGAFVTELLVEDGRAQGVWAQVDDGVPRLYQGQHIVLASGGAGQLFAYTTNPAVATGDGLALAYRAGAALADLEFYQFHPTALCVPGVPTFLVSEAVRG
ncbi:MAG: FAD-dependent oxidoreductase, partial [Chloroflexota bacterium]|nr:FAD-dependent oxidoreductase [Chloroflexota bacterium]